MKRLIRAVLTFVMALGCIAALPGAATATVYAQIEGTGSTWSELIVQQWIADQHAGQRDRGLRGWARWVYAAQVGSAV